MRIFQKLTSITAIPLSLLETVIRHALPNLALIAILVIVIAWYNVGFQHEFQRLAVFGRGINTLGIAPQEILTGSYRWLMGIPVVAIIVIDLVAISIFARGWHARRWGRKPPEIERATRYFYP